MYYQIYVSGLLLAAAKRPEDAAILVAAYRDLGYGKVEVRYSLPRGKGRPVTVWREGRESAKAREDAPSRMLRRALRALERCE